MPRIARSALETQDDPDFKKAREAFAARIRGLATRKGWSQSELAKRAGLGRDVVNKYFNARALPTPASLGKMATALGLSPIDLLPGIGALPTTATDGPTVPVAMRSTRDGFVFLQVNMEVPFELAIEILSKLPRADQEGDGKPKAA